MHACDIFICFPGVTIWKLQLLASLFRYVTIEKDKVLFEEGSLGQELYIIAKGRVQIQAMGERDNDHIVVIIV